MNNIFYMILNKFGEAVGMSHEFSQAGVGIAIALLAVALLLCFFGKKTFRMLAGITAFIITALGLIYLMKNAGMGEKVTAFSILGLLAAAITIRWYRISAFIIAGIIGYSIAAAFIDILWVNIAIAAVVAVAANMFPVYGIIILTSLWGGLMLGFEGANMLNMETNSMLPALISAGLAGLGFTVQYFTNKKLLKMPYKQRKLEISK